MQNGINSGDFNHARSVAVRRIEAVPAAGGPPPFAERRHEARASAPNRIRNLEASLVGRESEVAAMSSAALACDSTPALATGPGRSRPETQGTRNRRPRPIAGVSDDVPRRERENNQMVGGQPRRKVVKNGASSALILDAVIIARTRRHGFLPAPAG